MIVSTVRCRSLLIDKVEFVKKFGNKAAMEIHIATLKVTKWYKIKLYVNIIYIKINFYVEIIRICILLCKILTFRKKVVCVLRTLLSYLKMQLDNG